MLVVVSNREDVTADWLVLELQRRGTEHVRLNTEDYPSTIKLHWSLTDAVLAGGQLRLAAADVSAVWWRRPVPPRGSEGRTAAEAAWAAREARAALDGFWSATDAHWVNHPAANSAADCKPEQLLRARRLGFAVPATLVSSSPDEVRGFAAAHGDQIITKALVDGRVPTATGSYRLLPTVLLDAEQLAALASLGPEPAFFQELIPKAYDLRVKVIGDRAYACRIDSQGQPNASVDWRRGEVATMQHTAVELPAEVTNRCIELTASYGLRFAAIDLAATPDGRFVFFELNANGQWAWIEHLTGLPLAARLADELRA